MEFKQSFTVTRPLADVWALFEDVPAVAGCMPGAELSEDKGNGLYAGRIAIKLGPFTASFEGEAQKTTNPADHSGHVEGRGIDKRGGSRSKLVLDYRLTESNRKTTVDITANIQLSGPVAQFGRTGIIAETANFLIGQFVDNVEAKLAPPAEAQSEPTAAAMPRRAAPKAGGGISVMALVRVLIGSFFRRLFGGRGSA